MTKKLANDWLKTGNFLNGESTFLARNRDDVQKAIFAFVNTGSDLPEQPNRKIQDHYFVQGILDSASANMYGGGCANGRYSGNVPLVWWAGDLAEAVASYTNYNREHGACRRYHDDFSFQIKLLKPEWKCIVSRCGRRGWFEKAGPVEKGSYRWQQEIFGLSPWEKALKCEELEFLRACATKKHVEIREKLRMFFFIDPELDYISHLIYPSEEDRVLRLDPKAREAVVDAWRDSDDRYNRRTPSFFDLLLDDAYDALADAVNAKVIDRVVWQQADDVLQGALQNQPYKNAPVLPILRKMKYVNGLLELLEAYWCPSRRDRLEEIGRQIWHSIPVSAPAGVAAPPNDLRPKP